MRGILLFSFSIFFTVGTQLIGQSTVFIPQGGLTIGSQKWDNGSDRGLLFQWHGALAIESYNNDDNRAAVFMQLGYHVKGSATRFRFYTNGGGVSGYREQFKFNNISLILGAKQKRPLGSGSSRYYYFGGVRGDYTYSTNIDDLTENVGGNPFLLAVYPFIGSMNRFMVGVSAGAGIEVPFSDLVGAEFKLSVHPDFTLQYRQLGSFTINDPLYGTYTVGQRQIRNVCLELSMGLRLLRKVEYED